MPLHEKPINIRIDKVQRTIDARMTKLECDGKSLAWKALTLDDPTQAEEAMLQANYKAAAWRELVGLQMDIDGMCEDTGEGSIWRIEG